MVVHFSLLQRSTALLVVWLESFQVCQHQGILFTRNMNIFMLYVKWDSINMRLNYIKTLDGNHFSKLACKPKFEPFCIKSFKILSNKEYFMYFRLKNCLFMYFKMFKVFTDSKSTNYPSLKN